MTPIRPPYGNIPALGDTSRVTVTDIHVLPMAAVQFNAGGLLGPNTVMHLSVIDLPKQRQYLVPFNIRFAEGLLKQLTGLVNEHNAKALEK